MDDSEVTCSVSMMDDSKVRVSMMDDSEVRVSMMDDSEVICSILSLIIHVPLFYYHRLKPLKLELSEQKTSGFCRIGNEIFIFHKNPEQYMLSKF